MTKPLLSVVIPVYDAARYLDACFDTLLDEREVEFEVIAVDDGSRDHSAAILAARAALDPRLRVITRENRGPSAARNVGLAHAEGDYVWFVDADDIVVPHALAIIGAVARARDADIVSFNAESFGDDAGIQPLYSKPKPAEVVSGEAWIRWTTAQGEYLNYPWFQAVRRALLEQHRMRFVENMLHEDIGWVTECLLHAQRVFHLDQALYRYRRHAGSLTGGIDDARVLRRIDSYFIVVEQLRALAARPEISPSTRTCLRGQIVGQGLQVDRLGRALVASSARQAVRERCRGERFWQRLLADAPDWRSRRRVAKALLAERLGWQ